MKSFKSFTETPVDEACWKGYEKKGMKTMFGKRYPNCVKKTKKEEVELSNQQDDGEDKNLKSKEKRQAQIKKMVLLKKMQAVRAGAGADIVASHEPEGEMVEGSLHKWFSGSKSKDGKPGWVQSDGSPCANEPGETKTPKCYSSSKRASMSKKELRSADARKSKKDPNQQQKSGAAKPTYVATDKKKKVNEDKVLKTVAKELDGASKMHKGQSEKIKKHLKGMKKVDECWKTHKKVGMKKKGGKMVPDCRPKTQVTTEAKVDKGRSDYGKASIRNYRRSGPDTLEPAMFDPDNKRGKTIDKRREEHKARRGVKGAKVPTYKKEEVVLEADKKEKGSGSKDACYHKVKARYSVWPSAYASGALVKCRRKGAANWGNSSKKEEVEYVDEAKSAAWQRKEGKRESGGLNQKGVDSYRAANPGSKLKTAVTTKPSKLKKGSKSANRRKSFCARMGGMKKRLTSAKTARDPDSRINKALRKWNCSYEPDGTPIMEADKAFNTVLAALQKKHGKENIITKKNPMKPQSAADKAKARAHQAKVDKENAAERKKDPSQGRYPKG